MKKICPLLLAMLLLTALFSACASPQAENVTSESTPLQSANVSSAESSSSDEILTDNTPVRVMALKGPTAMGMVGMMADAEANAYDFSIVAAIDEIIPKLLQGEVDIAAVPANMSSILYNNTNGAIQSLAIHTLGVLYMVESGNTVKSIEDLRGKTIYASGKGATPEYALNYILSANGIDPEKDVTIEYKSEHSECVAILTQQENAIAMLPQPFVTTAQMKNSNLRVALDLNEEWEKAQSSDQAKSALITGVLVVRTAFAQEHPDAVSKFLDRYKESVSFVNSDTERAAALIEQYDIIPAAVAKKALPYCNITFIEGNEMQQKLSGYLAILLEQNPKSVGGTLPDEPFYYIR